MSSRLIWTRFQFLCGMLVWSLLVSMLRLCSLNANSETSQPILFAMPLQLERMFLQFNTETCFSEFDHSRGRLTMTS